MLLHVRSRERKVGKKKGWRKEGKEGGREEEAEKFSKIRCKHQNPRTSFSQYFFFRRREKKTTEIDKNIYFEKLTIMG